ncbi:hypothetical protein DFH06DRAFT_1101085, partial [Mycena polygramma]
MGLVASQCPEDAEKHAPSNPDRSVLTSLRSLFSTKPEQEKREHNVEDPEDRWRPKPTPPYSEAESRQAASKLWAIYIAEADRYDKALVDSWKADMEGMLIFMVPPQSGLFSASLTAFLIESYQTLQPDSGDMTVQLLSQISQQLVSISSNTSFAIPEPVIFQPTPSSLVCNTLWFISLTLSITCALLATLVEQWAREFLHRTEKSPSPIRRARIFSFLYFGVRRFGMHAVVDIIPMLLHVSLILFLARLIAFLLPINHLMTGLIAGILAVFLGLYSVLTVLPVVRLDSPYRTPFSTLGWQLIQKMCKMLPPALSTANSSMLNMNDAIINAALTESGSRDQQALAWTMDSLTDDNELIPFLEAIPEALFWPKGFHLINDSIFIPLLNGPKNQPSLGTRIGDILICYINMAPENPARQR